MSEKVVDTLKQWVQDNFWSHLQESKRLVQNVEENTFWDGDRLTVNGKQGPPLKGGLGQSLDSAYFFSVKDFGATGDGDSDDTLPIQSALDHVGSLGGGTVFIPSGTYMIRGDDPDSGRLNFLRDTGGLGVKSNTHLLLHPDAVLKAIPTDERAYVIVRLFNVENVKVSGGRIVGERHEHLGERGGEWGYGVAISGGRDILLEDTSFEDCFGDGINIQRIAPPSPDPENIGVEVAHNVVIKRVTCSGNLRQGMSVEGVIGLHVEDSIFRDTGDRPPSAGVDIEPYNSGAPIENMVFRNCQFINNRGCGMLVMMPQLDGLVVEDCFFDGNRDSESQLKTYTLGKKVHFNRNKFVNTPLGSDSILVQGGEDIHVLGNTTDSRIHVRQGPSSDLISSVWVSRNTVDTQSRATTPISITRANRVFVSENIFTGGESEQCVSVIESSGINFLNNHIDGSKRGVWIKTLSSEVVNSDFMIKDNTFKDSRFSGIVVDDCDSLSITGNVFSGIGRSSSSNSCIHIGRNTPRLTVSDNNFTKESSTPEVEVLSTSAISWKDDSEGDSVIYGNRVHSKEDYSYSLWGEPHKVLTSGYVLEGGVMSVPTIARPTSPATGMQLFDTTIGIFINWNGTAWVDAIGEVV